MKEKNPKFERWDYIYSTKTGAFGLILDVKTRPLGKEAYFILFFLSNKAYWLTFEEAEEFEHEDNWKRIFTSRLTDKDFKEETN